RGDSGQDQGKKRHAENASGGFRQAGSASFGAGGRGYYRERLSVHDQFVCQRCREKGRGVFYARRGFGASGEAGQTAGKRSHLRPHLRFGFPSDSGGQTSAKPKSGGVWTRTERSNPFPSVDEHVSAWH